jgi:uncharacterized membrane protein
MNEGFFTIAVTLSVLVVGVYEVQEVWAARRDPVATARSAHRLLRGEWVRALSKQPGSEIIAVQALRNSVMSATITASTAVLVLMGAVSLMASGDSGQLKVREVSLHTVLELVLVLALFATYVCSTMAMRYYHHAGFILSMPVGSPERTPREPVAGHYVQRAGILYSWSLRCFLYSAPVAIGLVNPLAMPVASLALVGVLAFFDRAPRHLDE